MLRFLAIAIPLLVTGSGFAAEPPKLNILFLGDNAGHKPKDRFAQLEPVLLKRGIALKYTDSLDDITLANLNKYDGLMIFANHGKGTPEQVKAILDYVASGKGFIPLHCASFCFIDNKDYVDLVGAQFRSHTTGTFRTKAVKPEHPIMKGFSPFESWDETYVHTKHNEKDRTVLEVRAEKDLEEPWTWVRTHGKGRVFYTAWGHDQRTWGHEGFHNLVERGTRWACGQDPALAGEYADAPKMKPILGDPKDFTYRDDAKIPFYPPSKTWGTIAEPKTKMQNPLSPEKSVTHYTMPEGFEMRLFAADEQFGGGKPIAMTWDDRGRLWVSVTMDYPNERKQEGEGRDKILILEDTDGDGKADKITVFADKLSIPTSLLFVRGGVIVHQAPDTLFLKDTDGDGKADLRIKLITGWGTNDTHAGPSNLRYGFDNWIYGMVGYSGFVGIVNGEKLNFKQGLYRFKFDGKTVSKLEFLRSTSNNSWGVGFDETGELFGSTANGCVLVHMPIPNRYYEKVKGLNPAVLAPIADNKYYPVTDKVRQVDWHGGYTSAAGCTIYTARTYPKEYWNRTAFVSDPTGHLTAAFVLSKEGTSYTARHGWNLVASQDEWAAPIDAQVGPDGNVWVLDWYNFIVQHNPVPQGFKNGAGNAYETPLRDKKHGRIYRVVYTKAKPEKQPDLKDAKVETLVETLKNDNMFWRLHAQRLLVEKGGNTAEQQLFDVLSVRNKTKFEPAHIHALWTLQALGALEREAKAQPDDFFRRLKPEAFHPSVQAQLFKAVSPAMARIPNFALAFVNGQYTLFPNPDRTAQLAFLLDCMAAAPHSLFALSLWRDLETQPMAPEPNLLAAYTIAAIAQGDVGLSVLLAGPKPRPHPAHLLAIAELVASDFGSKGFVPSENVNGSSLEYLLRSLAETKQPDVAAAVIAGLSKGWKQTGPVKLTAGGEKSLAQALTTVPANSRGKLLKLASTWGVKGLDAQLAQLTKGLLAVVADAKATDTARIDAAKQVLEFQPADEAAAMKLLEALTPTSSPELSSGIIEVLGQSKAKSLGATLVEKLPKLPVLVRPGALRLVLARPESAKAFLDGVEKGTLRFDMLQLDQKQALSAHPDKQLAERAKKLLALGGGLPDANRQKVIDELKPILLKTGDVPNGKKMFTTHCAKCHKHGAEGLQIGPDLTGFAVHPKEEILIHVLDPSRSVEGNYKAYTAKHLDGRVVTGVMSAQTKTTVELRDAENKLWNFPLADLDELLESKLSLMPEGFEKQMKAEELTDLLEFLTQKGKYVPIPLDKYATTTTTKGMFFEDAGVGERLVFKDWTPKTFEGVPFALTDPQGDKIKNAILLYGPNGKKAPLMPKSITMPCNTAAKAIHFLSGIGGWNFPSSDKKTVSMIVRLNYADGKSEDHELKNGIHFADYIGRADVPESKFAFAMTGGQQVRYLAVTPKRTDAVIKTVELIKGPDSSAPVVMAVTIETP